PRRPRWTWRRRSPGCPRGPDRCSCCTTSKGTGTRKSPTCWAWRPVPRSPSSIGPGWHCGSISSGEDSMSDVWTDRLSEYLDDELPPRERATLEVHLAQCAECSATLADLRRVV